jgi:uncharacterized membrane protein YqjE
MDSAPPVSKSSAVPNPPEGLSASLAAYLEARSVLLTIEAQEAVQQVLRTLVFAIIGGITALTGWMLLVAALIGLVVDRTGWHWLKASTIVGGANLVLAFIFLLAMSKRLGSMRWFADTLNEFKKDRAWLARQTGKR